MAKLRDRMKWALMGYFDECETSIYANVMANRNELIGRCSDGVGYLDEAIGWFNRSRVAKSNLLHLCLCYCMAARGLLVCAINGILDIKTALREANALCEKALSILCDMD